MIACLTSEDDNQLVRNATKPAALMSRFEALLRSKLDGPVYLTEICSELGIGERMLRYHCQEHLGMNPHRYLWLRRMQLAQQALRRADGSRSTVTSIANDYGFGELGAFRSPIGDCLESLLRQRLSADELCGVSVVSAPTILISGA
jgi:AraC-like DNA-binding protein